MLHSRQMNVRLRYGCGEIELSLPSYLDVVSRLRPLYRDKEYVSSIDILIRRALSNSIGVSLKELVSRSKKGEKSTVVILSDDISRPTPAWAIVPYILKELNSLGIGNNQVKIIIALGTHREMNNNELKMKLGEEILKQVEVTQHDAYDYDKLLYMGKTSSGIAIWLNKEYYEADIKIGLGNIAPHPAAGWSGGSKIVVPGVCGAETVDMVHFYSALHPIEDIFGVRDNVIRNELDEIALKSGLGMIINTVLDGRKKVIDIVAGDVVDAHRYGVEIAEDIYRPKTPIADIAIVSAYPYDIDYWQAGKGYLAAYLALRRGGAAILFAKLPEGISAIPQHSKTLLTLGNLTPNEIEVRVRRGEVDDVAAASVAMLISRVREKVELYIVTDSLNSRECEKLGLIKISPREIDDVIEKTRRKFGKNPGILIIEDSSIAPHTY